ncbi:hypothetical protein H5410_009859 [Solanum commersonii]|uniref:Uncharacterized protein n=1 Tax=Solanum commersonii TaxID=4109 RepID=A0A9J6AJM0_SOLCO|nr:hypothetical protein H5410_009859 [Solanum commersonii]
MGAYVKEHWSRGLTIFKNTFIKKLIKEKADGISTPRDELVLKYYKETLNLKKHANKWSWRSQVGGQCQQGAYVDCRATSIVGLELSTINFKVKFGSHESEKREEESEKGKIPNSNKEYIDKGVLAFRGGEDIKALLLQSILQICSPRSILRALIGFFRIGG